MEALIPKWHRELELFSAVKPLLILEGNITDQYRYPVDGSVGVFLRRGIRPGDFLQQPAGLCQSF